MLYHTGTADTHIDDGVGLRHTVESTGHERIVVGRIAQHDKFRTTERIALLRSLRSFLYDASHQTYGIHVDARLGRTHIHRTAYTLRHSQSFRNGTYEELIAGSHALRHHGTVSAEEVHTHCLCRLVEGTRNLHIIFGSPAARSAHKRNRCDGNPLVDDRHSELARNVLAGLHKILGKFSNLAVDIVAGLLHACICTIEQTYAHGDGTHVKVLLLNHLVGLNDLCYIYHVFPYSE